MCGRERGKDSSRGWGVRSGRRGVRAHGDAVCLGVDRKISSSACRWGLIPSPS